MHTVGSHLEGKKIKSIPLTIMQNKSQMEQIFRCNIEKPQNLENNGGNSYSVLELEKAS